MNLLHTLPNQSLYTVLYCPPPKSSGLKCRWNPVDSLTGLESTGVHWKFHDLHSSPPKLSAVHLSYSMARVQWSPLDLGQQERRTPWDHAINLKDDFIPKDCKVYPLTVLEQAELDKFLKENLEKGYIQPSKSPMASPFFFINKKDGMENYDPVRTTEPSMKELSKMCTHYPCYNLL